MKIMCIPLVGAGPNPHELTPLIQAVLDVIGVDSPNLCGLDVVEGDTEEWVDYFYISLYDKSTALGAGHAEQLRY